MATILTYHHIAPPPASGAHSGLFVAPERFAEQMAFLRKRDYRVVGLDEVRDDLLGRRTLPRRSVAITFDDGGADNADKALPVLRQHGFRATVFLVAGKTGQKRDKPAWPESATRYLDESEIAEMGRNGIVFGSHTLTHARLAAMPAESRDRELAESKRLIAEMTGQPVDWLSYPFGSFSLPVIDAAKQAGYVGAVSTIRDNRLSRRRLYYLPRVMVMPDTDLRRFAYYFSLPYHWIHYFKNRRRWAKHERPSAS